MHRDAVVIEKEAMSLTRLERALLADRLFQSLENEDENVIREWATEVESRLDDYHCGKINALDGPSVVKSLRDKLK